MANSGGSWRTRHLRLREHWLAELVDSGEYQLLQQPGLDQLADGLTKQLASERSWRLFEAWGFVEGPALSGIRKLHFFEGGDADVATAHSAAAAHSTATTAELTTAIEHPTPATVVNGRTLSRCIQVVIGLWLVAGVFGDKDFQVHTCVDSDYELWIAVLVVMVTTILVWEWSKKAAGGVKRAVKMKMMKPAARQGLSKPEGKELLGLLGLETRSVEQEARLAVLINKFQLQNSGGLGALHGEAEASSDSRGRRDSTSTSRSSVPSAERVQSERWSRGVQTDPEPAVSLKEPFFPQQWIRAFGTLCSRGKEICM